MLILAIESKSSDWLGEIYMSLEIENKTSGQFYTPYSISLLMAELTFHGQEKILQKQRWLGYYEPCCGSGSMIIAFAEVMKRNKYNYQKQLYVLCEDIDENWLLMTYIQLSLMGIDAICKVKNSLTLTEYSTWSTPVHHIYRKK